MSRKVSVQANLTEEQYQRLRALSDRTKVSASEYLRQAVDLVLEREAAADDGLRSLGAT